MTLQITGNTGSCPVNFQHTVQVASDDVLAGTYIKTGDCSATTVTGTFAINKYNCPTPATLACPTFLTDSVDTSGCNETRDEPEPGIYFNKFYDVAAIAGETLTVTVSSYYIDAYVYLYFNGVLVASDDDGAGGSDARVVYNVPTDGSYRIKVSSRYPLSAGTYGLSVSGCNGTVSPTSLAYVTNAGSNSVSVIDTSLNTVVATVPVASSPGGIAVSRASARAYTTHYDANSVTVIDASKNAAIATVPVGTRPLGVAVDPSGARVYVANSFDSTLSVIDGGTNAVIGTIAVPGSGHSFGNHPYGVAVNAAGTRVYVTNNGDGTLSVIDTATKAQLAAISMSTSYSGPFGVALNPAGTRVYVANNGDSSLAVIDTSSNSVVATVPLGDVPWAVAVSPDGSRAYVSCGYSDFAGSVVIVDTATNAVVSTVSASALFSHPYGIGFSPDGTRAYVAVNAASRVAVIDTASKSVIATISVGSAPAAFGLFITSSAPTCTSFSIQPTSVSPNSSASSQLVAITGSPANCFGGGWSATGNGSWLTVSPTSGSGSGSTTVSWTQNISASSRTDGATIAQHTFTVAQSGASPQTCTSFSIQPSSVNPGSSAGSQLVTVTGSPANCVGGSWSASGNGSWLIVSPASGSGSGSTTVSWTQNTSANSRTGTATIAQNSFTATQSGAAAQSCTSFTIQPSSVSPNSSAGSQAVTIIGSPPNCVGGSWSASGNGSWLTVFPTSDIVGSTTVYWTQNTSASSRTGTATIAQNAFTVTQAAASVIPPQTVTIGVELGSGNSGWGGGTIVSLDNPATANGSITTVTFRWTYGSRSCADVAKIKFFRRSGNILTLTAERGPFPALSNLNSNYNTVTLSTPVSVQAGDLIGMVNMAADGSCGAPQGLAGTTTNGLIVFSGDLKGNVNMSDGFTWPNPIALFGTGFVPPPPRRRAARH